MKLLPAVLCLIVAAECTPQFGRGGASLPLASKKTMKPRLRENAQRVMLSYGPLVMPGVNVSQRKARMGSSPTEVHSGAKRSNRVYGPKRFRWLGDNNSKKRALLELYHTLDPYFVS
jgi:hypothetical protein